MQVLGGMQEAERTLFFFSGLMRMRGEWQAALLDAPLRARQAATDWLHFAATPSMDPDYCVSCQPACKQDRVRPGRVRGTVRAESGK